VTTDEGNGTLYSLVTTNATETAATVKASGATQTITSVGSKSVTASGLTAATAYYMHFVHRDTAGNDSARVSSASFTTATAGDTTPPVISTPTATATGSTTASGTVSTNEANGALYRYASTNATETAATIKASGAFTAVTATGAQTVAFTGLPPSTTLYAHYLHRDAAGNDSNVVNSAAFTTSAATTYSLLTDALTNNTGSLWAPGTTVNWDWYAGGRIGSLSGITPTQGTSVLDSASKAPIAGLPAAGAGVLLGAVRVTSATDDNVFYQSATAA
jgi:hypothetical protein